MKSKTMNVTYKFQCLKMISRNVGSILDKSFLIGVFYATTNGAIGALPCNDRRNPNTKNVEIYNKFKALSASRVRSQQGWGGGGNFKCNCFNTSRSPEKYFAPWMLISTPPALTTLSDYGQVYRIAQFFI